MTVELNPVLRLDLTLLLAWDCPSGTVWLQCSGHARSELHESIPEPDIVLDYIEIVKITCAVDHEIEDRESTSLSAVD